MFRRRPHASSAVLMAPRLSPTLLAALGLASCDGCRDLPLGACLEPAPVNDDGDPRVGPCLTPMANPPPDQPPPDQRPPEDPPFGACLKIAPPDPDPVTHPCLEYAVPETIPEVKPPETPVHPCLSPPPAPLHPCLSIAPKPQPPLGEVPMRPCLSETPEPVDPPAKEGRRAPEQRDAVESVLARRVLPEDVAARLRSRRG